MFKFVPGDLVEILSPSDMLGPPLLILARHDEWPGDYMLFVAEEGRRHWYSVLCNEKIDIFTADFIDERCRKLI